MRFAAASISDRRSRSSLRFSMMPFRNIGNTIGHTMRKAKDDSVKWRSGLCMSETGGYSLLAMYANSLVSTRIMFDADDENPKVTPPRRKTGCSGTERVDGQRDSFPM